MQNNFTVTEEIYEYFKDKAVTINSVKKYIPNYMDYATVETVEVDDEFQDKVSYKLNKLLFDQRIVTTPEELSSNIYDIMCNEGGGSQILSVLLDEYSGFTVYTVKTKDIRETDDQVLNRIKQEINTFKTRRKNQIKVSQELLEIASNETLMQELLKLREQIQVKE